MEATRESEWLQVGVAADSVLADIARRATWRNWIVFAEQASELNVNLAQEIALAHRSPSMNGALNFC
jgi:hypothetical protein